MHVRSDAELVRALARLLDSGGKIVLLPNRYGQVTVGARSASLPLEIVGTDGVQIERVLVEGSARVSLRSFAVVPRWRDAWIEVRNSTTIELSDLLVTARGTTYSASVLVPGSRDVRIRGSTFTHCGDRSLSWTNCLRVFDGSSDILIEENWFHDCYGCDFIHGRPGSGFVVRRNRFERALPCQMGQVRCGHQDLIELFDGRWLRFEGNFFGIYRRGGAQLYLTGPMDHVFVTNNLFVGTDRRVPGYRSPVALIVGSRGPGPFPLHVTIANNTILTGARRDDGYAGSLRMNSLYRRLPESARPIVANNVIALLESRWPVCGAVQRSVANVVVVGRRCSTSDRVGKPHLDASGRPTRRSTLLIGKAARKFATSRDATGRPRDRQPDIGAYEYRAYP